MDGLRQLRVTVLGVALVALPLAGSDIQAARAPSWTVATGDVRVICPMTIGGSFEARTTSLTGHLSVEPGATALAGELFVELKTLDTGISLRNQHMLETYLEVEKGVEFGTAALSDIDVGTLADVVPEGRRTFAARLHLHGTTRAVSGAATLSMHGSAVRVDASFPIRFSDYDIATPRHLGVGVRDEVTVHVVFLASPLAHEEVVSP